MTSQDSANQHHELPTSALLSGPPFPRGLPWKKQEQFGLDGMRVLSEKHCCSAFTLTQEALVQFPVLLSATSVPCLSLSLKLFPDQCCKIKLNPTEVKVFL